METKIADNYIYDSILDKSLGDSDKTPFIKKTLNYVVDQQAGNGTYTSGQIIIDSTSLAGSGDNYQDWSNAYIVLPYNVKLTATGSTASTVSPATLSTLNYLTSLKNNAVIDSITVEQAGRTIINQTSNLSQFVNFKMHSTTSNDNLNKMSASLQYYPDSVGSYSYTDGVASANNNVVNNFNLPYSTNFSSIENYNDGVLKRQQKLAPITTGLTTVTKQINEGDVVQAATGNIVGGLSTLSDLHFLMTIRLKDLSDYFAKHPKVTRGVGYKITIRVNQGTSVLVNSSPTASTTPFSTMTIAGQTFTGIGGSIVQPAMIHVGASTISTLTTIAPAATFTAGTLTLTSQVDIGPNALLNGVRLYLPGYQASPKAQEVLLSQPVLQRPFLDLYFNQIQNQLAGSYINSQIATGISSPKAIIIVPQIAQNKNSFNSQASALNPCPGVTDPQLSLTNTQVKLGSNYVLPDRVNYDFVQFLENTSQMFGLNGNQTDMLSSGIIDFAKFRHNYRYYVYDLSRYTESQNGLPQMITLESFNNSNVAVDLYVYVLYERQAEFSLVKGSVQVE